MDDKEANLYRDIRLRTPVSTDAYALNQLIAASPPLDTNSIYCNLLHTSHFAQTSVAATKQNKLVGYISAYIPPTEPDTLFVWQVVVSKQLRGYGLGKRMLRWILESSESQHVTSMATTITKDNKASWALFESFAQEFNAKSVKSLLFSRDQHFAGAHDDEYLLRISPLTKSSGMMKEQNIFAKN